MTKVVRFEDLSCWQEGRNLVNLIYKTTNNPTFKDFGLKNQIQRAAVSIISNIAEGFERGTREEFIHFLYIAKGSCGEVRAQTYVAFDQKYITNKELETVSNKAQQVSAIIYRLIESLKVSKYKGLKYKKSSSQNDSWNKFMQQNYPDIYNKLLNPDSEG
jgi:four helix bundle protein